MAFDKKTCWKEYYSRPEVRSRILANKKKYRSQPEVKEKERLYRKKFAEDHPDYWKEWRAKNRKLDNETKRIYHNNHKSYRDEYRKQHLSNFVEYAKTYRSNHPDIAKAHDKISTLAKKGRIKKECCEKCGSEVAEAHHDDYSKPLEVRWLCKTCHMEWHRFNKAKH